MKKLMIALLFANLAAFADVPAINYVIESDFQQSQALPPLTLQQGAGAKLRFKITGTRRYLPLAGLTGRWEGRSSITSTVARQALSTLTYTSAVPNYIEIDLDSDQTGSTAEDWVWSFIVSTNSVDYVIGTGSLQVVESAWTGSGAITTNTSSLAFMIAATNQTYIDLKAYTDDAISAIPVTTDTTYTNYIAGDAEIVVAGDPRSGSNTLSIASAITRDSELVAATNAIPGYNINIQTNTTTGAAKFGSVLADELKALDGATVWKEQAYDDWRWYGHNGNIMMRSYADIAFLPFYVDIYDGSDNVAIRLCDELENQLLDTWLVDSNAYTGKMIVGWNVLTAATNTLRLAYQSADGTTLSAAADYTDTETASVYAVATNQIPLYITPATNALNNSIRADLPGITNTATGDVLFNRVTANEIYAQGSGGLKLYNDGGNGAFLNDDGYLGIGTADPETHLDLSKIEPQFLLTDTSELADNQIMRIQNRNQKLYFDARSGDNGGMVTANILVLKRTGEVGIKNGDPSYLLEMEASGGGYYDTSDHDWHTGSSHRSIKTNIQPTDDLDALSILKDVKVRKGQYRRWRDRFEAQTNRIAKIEQKQVDSNTVATVTNMVDKVEMVKVGQEEIEPGPEVLMYVVDELPPSMPNCVISTNGNLGMRQAFLILTKAIQQQQQQIDALNKRIKTLEDAR